MNEFKIEFKEEKKFIKRANTDNTNEPKKIDLLISLIFLTLLKFKSKPAQNKYIEETKQYRNIFIKLV